MCWGKTNTNSTDCREWDTLSWTQRQKEKEMWTQRKIDRGVGGVSPTPSPSTTACLFGVSFICLTLFYPFCVCVSVYLFALLVWLFGSSACCPLATAHCPLSTGLRVSALILHINFYLFIYLICFLRAFFFIDVNSSLSSCTCFFARHLCNL